MKAEEKKFVFCNTAFKDSLNSQTKTCPKCGYPYVNAIGTCGRKIFKQELNH